MPTFDFRCKSCSHRFSEFVSIKEKDNVKCPKCSGNVEQLFTGFMFVSSGSGNSSPTCSGKSCSRCSGC